MGKFKPSEASKYKSLKKLTYFLTCLLYLYIALRVILVLVNSYAVYFQIDITIRLVASTANTLLLILIFIFLYWIYRANYNCWLLGATHMRSSPRWAVAWFFIPIACLWKSYEVVVEIWRASSMPKEMQKAGYCPLLPTVWWLIPWVYQFLSWYIEVKQGDGANLYNNSSVYFWVQIGNILLITFLFVTISMVKKIHYLQTIANEKEILEQGALE